MARLSQREEAWHGVVGYRRRRLHRRACCAGLRGGRHRGRRPRRPLQRPSGLRRGERGLPPGQRPRPGDTRKRLRSHPITGVVHLAAFKYAGVSVSRPLHTYSQNVTGMIILLETMAAHAVDKFVFSSSAAVFGTPDTSVVTEESPTRPESPYGESKLIGEWLLRDQARATASEPNPLRHTSLRYFNVVGSGYPDLYDTSPHNLFPLVLEALVAGQTPHINGDAFPTPDGTCVRDYVHVSDLAASHVTAAQALEQGRALEPVYNL